jgi:RsiW-degrading membrane proteinase PrsW (M82 family)
MLTGVHNRAPHRFDTSDAGAMLEAMEVRGRSIPDLLVQYGWVRFGLAGALLWGVSVLVTLVTKDTILLPTVVLLGSFVVPVTWVWRAVEHNQANDLPLPLIMRTFVYGGVAGILSAALLESWLLRYSGQGFYIGVGLIEEAMKLAVLWHLGRRLRNRSMVNGLVLGATVGFGFAAFESSGYALNALYGAGGLSIRSLVSTEAVRALITPVSHGLWTAIAGAVLFRDSGGGRLRLTRGVIRTYGFVSLLHALWDLAPAFALTVTLYTSGQGWHLNLLGEPGWLEGLVHGPVGLYQAVDDVILVVIGTIGLVAVHRYRRRALATRRQPQPQRQPQPAHAVWDTGPKIGRPRSGRLGEGSRQDGPVRHAKTASEVVADGGLAASDSGEVVTALRNVEKRRRLGRRLVKPAVRQADPGTTSLPLRTVHQ